MEHPTNNNRFDVTYEQAIEGIVNKAYGAKLTVKRCKKDVFQYVFLVGAGVSVASNIPDADSMCTEIRKNFEQIKDEDIEENMKKGMSK